MEPDHYARYSQVVAQCKDIEIEIHSHYREMFPCGANEITALNQESGSFCCTDRKNRLSRARPLYITETTGKDFIVSDRESHTSNFILRCRDGSGANLYYIKSLYYRSAASAILHSANPSSTFISSNATCTAPCSWIYKLL